MRRDRSDSLIIAWFVLALLGIWVMAIMSGWQAYEEHVANRQLAAQFATEQAEMAQERARQGAVGGDSLNLRPPQPKDYIEPL